MIGKLLFVLAFSCLAAKQSICLNMIVKDEQSIIAKNLASAKQIIDYWVIVDTGSTDGTQEEIRRCMQGVPGELHERPWVDFEHNRNEALALARGKADYILMMDADETFLFDAGFQTPLLTEDGYLFSFHKPGGAMQFHRLWMIRDDPGWRWVGILHETLENPRPHTRGVREGISVFLGDVGRRTADPEKQAKDAKTLEAALEKEPNHSRYLFYLAQTYVAMGEYAKALTCYEKRAALGGFEEEVYISLYRIAQMRNALRPNAELFLDELAKAFRFRPSRAEPIYMMGNQFICSENYLQGYRTAQFGAAIPLPSDSLWVQTRIYDWGFLYQQAFCAAKVGYDEEAKQLFGEILEKKSIPLRIRSECEKSLRLLKNGADKKNFRFIGI